MKKSLWQIELGVILVALSALFYGIHYAIFRDAHHILLYLIGDIAFVFIEVMLVTLIIHEVLSLREKRALMEKLNMVIGAFFFSEVGTRLLGELAACDPGVEKIRRELFVTGHWTKEQFARAKQTILSHECKIDSKCANLVAMRETLLVQREFLLRLLENPNLLEHDTFTGLLMAVFHLTEELVSRQDVRQLSEADQLHIAVDMKRAYGLLMAEWLDYMQHLRGNYPYLFSFAMRMNPFDPSATPEIGGPSAGIHPLQTEENSP
ncbi:MAG: hypothetical protein LLG97_18320 [Deltaproteobacteria bacterium]|nr:hypothetical protein [Deltaproteobacteria bacterium]